MNLKVRIKQVKTHKMVLFSRNAIEIYSHNKSKLMLRHKTKRTTHSSTTQKLIY